MLTVVFNGTFFFERYVRTLLKKQIDCCYSCVGWFAVLSVPALLVFICFYPPPTAAAVNDQEVSNLINQMEALIENEEYRLAVLVGDTCIETAEKKFGKSHIEIFRCMFRQAQVYKQIGEYNKTVTLLQNCLEILNKSTEKSYSYGFEHHVVHALARIHHKLGDYTKAESLYKRAIETVIKKFGNESPDVIPPMTSLGLLYIEIQEYTKAVALYKKCLENITINNDKYGNEAALVQHLANANVKIGEYAQAETLYKHSVEIAEKRFGKESRNTAGPLASLGELYVRTGQFAKAESFCSRALEISEKTSNGTKTEVARSLSCLGDLYQAIGDFSKAQQLYQRSIDSTGSTDPDFAFVIHKMAQIYYLTDDYPQAISLYEESQSLIEKTLGKEHPHLVPLLHDLGLCYWRVGDDAKSLSLLQQSLHIAEKKLGKNSPDVIAPLNSLARLHTYKGDYKTAEPLAKRSLEISEEIFGKDHHELVDKLYSLALIKHAQSDARGAWDQLLRLNTIDDALIKEVFGFTSEKQKMAYLARTKRYINLSLRELINLASNKQAVKNGFNLWLKRKGLVLESQKQFQNALFHSDDPKTGEIFKKLAAVRTKLSNLIFTDPDKEGLEAYRQKIADLEIKKEKLEGELSALSQTFAVHTKKAKVDGNQIAKSLPANSVLIDFARIDAARIDFDRISAAKKSEPSAHYVAFVLPAGTGGQVMLVDLGAAEPIEQLLAELKGALDSRTAQPGTTQSAQAVTKVSTSLYKLVFKPLRAKLGPSKEIFLSPDGALNLLPFEILCDESERFLIQEYTFNYIATSRDLLGFDQLQGKAGKNLIMGNPDYYLDNESRETVVRQLNLKRGMSSDPYLISRELRNFRFTALPGTQQEVEAIRAVLGEHSSEFFLGKEALEDVLTTRTAPGIIHLATHGFYLSDQRLPSTETPGNMEISLARLGQGEGSDAKSSLHEDPLVRSGIALAGANTSIDSQIKGQNNGIVTAEKILNLNLIGTDLVVLSACESGLGDVKSGEGIFGLRRAFSQAGAKSMVMSMWSVPDEETKDLMAIFYKNLQSGSMNRAQALRQAALEQMQAVKSKYGHANPFFWGAFIFVGER
jgi:CHAT domain-containing protein/tetratricopeptide (TPR) repeat protein